MLDALRHDLFRDLVKGHASGLLVAEPQQLLEMPGNRLSFTVRVRREVDDGSLFALRLQLINQILLVLDRDILRLEPVFQVHAQLALRQVSQVAHGCGHLVIPAKIFFNGLGLGR